MGRQPIHRLHDNEVPHAIAALAAGGGTARTRDTWDQDVMTALVLAPADEPGPLMPLCQRTLAVAPGRTLRAGWISSNQFASRMSTRRQSRATVSEWPELLPDLDALLVVRRDEPSLVGRWYAQAGFHSILSIRCLYLDMDEPLVGPTGLYHMRVCGLEELAHWQPHMLAVYHEVFGHYGGPVVRHAGFWQPALRRHFYQAHYQFQVIGLWQAGTAGTADETLMGYAVVGWSGWHSKRPRMDILELATRQWDTRVAEELIRTTCQLAWSKQVREVRAVVSVHDPYRSYLARTGFEDRWGYVMQAKWLHPQRSLDALAGAEVLGDLSVQIDAPGQVSLTLGRGTRRVRLQGDEEGVTRLLLQRLEVAAAVREGTLLAVEATEADLARVAVALPWTPWVFHMLDYV